MDTLVSVEHARRVVLASARVLPPEPVPLAEAVGRTLAAPVAADGPLPPFDTSAMDGYAVRLADLAGETTLPLARHRPRRRRAPPATAGDVPRHDDRRPPALRRRRRRPS